MDIDLVFKIAAVGIVVRAQSAARALGPSGSGNAREPGRSHHDDDAARAGDQLAV